MGRPLDVRRPGSSTVSARDPFTILLNNDYQVLCEETCLYRKKADEDAMEPIVSPRLIDAFNKLVENSEDGPKSTQKKDWAGARNMFRRFGTALVSQSGDSVYMINVEKGVMFTVPVKEMVGLGDLARLERESKLDIKAQAASLSLAR